MTCHANNKYSVWSNYIVIYCYIYIDFIYFYKVYPEHIITVIL